VTSAPDNYPLLILTIVAGLLLGAVARALAYLAPTDGAILPNLSKCPVCGQPQALRDRLPLLGSLFGRRRKLCDDKFRFRDPIVEIATAGGCLLMVRRFGLTPELPAFLLLIPTLAALAAVDLDCRRIPNRLLYPMTAVAVPLLGAAAFIEGRPQVFVRALLGGIVYFIPMFLLGLLIPSSMGFGDIKLAGYLGLHLGWVSLFHVAIGAFFGFFIGAVVGVGLILVGKKRFGRRDTVPFGPSMVLGCILALLIPMSASAVLSTSLLL
jgi:leader peptidase (prepilin peptidase)/N-methyltransferase